MSSIEYIIDPEDEGASVDTEEFGVRFSVIKFLTHEEEEALVVEIPSEVIPQWKNYTVKIERKEDEEDNPEDEEGFPDNEA